MKSKKVLRMKIKDIIDFCDTHRCTDECPYQKLCIFKNYEGGEYTVISMLSYNVEKWLANEKVGE